MKLLKRYITILFCQLSLMAFNQELKLGLPIGHTSVINSIEFSPISNTLLTSSDDGTAKLWDIATSKLLINIKGESTVNLAKYSPNGKTVVTISENVALIWNAYTGELVKSLEGHTDDIIYVEFSPNGKFIVTVSYDEIAIIWDALTGKQKYNLDDIENDLHYKMFSPDSKKLITLTSFFEKPKDKSLKYKSKIWDVNSGKIIHILDNYSNVYISRDGSKIVALNSFEGVNILDFKTAKVLTNYPDINSIVFSPDESLVLIKKKDKSLKLYRVSKPLEISQKTLGIDLRGVVTELNNELFSPKGDKIISTEEKTVKILDIKSGNIDTYSFNNQTGFIEEINFNKEGNLLALTFSGVRIVKLLDIYSGTILNEFKGKTKKSFRSKFSNDGKKIALSNEDNSIYLYETETGKFLYNLKGHTESIESLEFSTNDELILSSSEDKTLKLWDANEGKLLYSFEGHESYIKSAKFSPDNSKIVSASWDGTVKVWDISSGKIIYSLENHNSWVNMAIFSPDNLKIASVSNSGLLITDAVTSEIISRVPVEFSQYVDISNDNSKIVVASTYNGVLVWDLIDKKLLHHIKYFKNHLESAKFNQDGTKLLVKEKYSPTKIIDVISGNVIYELKGYEENIYYADFSQDGSLVVSFSYNGYGEILNLNSGKILHKIQLESGFISCAGFNKKYNKILATQKDGSTVIYDVKTGNKLIRHLIFDSDPNNWVHLHPSGLFDASPKAMEMMYWTKGLEIIDFSQLKEKYYMPGLWEKVMKGEYLGNVDIKRDGIQLQPEVVLGEIKNNILPITLIKREGGYGELSILLNDKEIIKDARPKNFNHNLNKQTINLDVSQFNHLTKNGENEFTVKVKNSTGDVQSRGTIVKNKIKKEFNPPSFYGLFIGVNDYVGDIDLKYPVPDVNAMYNALELGANNLFGKDKTHLYKLTTAIESRPRKEIIKQKLAEIAQKAKPEDVLFIYLSGHGLTWTDTNNESDFYFLTEDARFANKQAYNDKDTREQTAISTNEWVEYIKTIAANKTVMVIDACGSGQAVENLIAYRDIESSQIKAIDRMKDRTGMFVISGSAADRVSYEASKYGQGLLTYTLLKAMSGVALKENKNIDVSTLFNYAKDEVPLLAKDIGGIQEPQVLIPKSGSVDIGILNSKDQSKIEIKEPKDVYVRSTLINIDELEDNLELSGLLDEYLNNSNSKTRGKDIIWVDAKKYANGCKISGSYTQESNTISLNFKIKCKDKQTKHQVTAKTKEEIIELILEKL